MIRGSTVLALGLVLGVTCALVGRQGSEKDQKSQSVLADIEPDINKALDNKDDTGANDHKESAEHVSDPIFGWFRKGRKRRCRRYRYRRRPCATPRPRPTQKPTQACSSSKPIDIQWDNDWQKRFVFQCPRGKTYVTIDKSWTVVTSGCSTLLFKNTIYRVFYSPWVWTRGKSNLRLPYTFRSVSGSSDM